MSQFPGDYPVTTLRGERRPNRRQVMRLLANRCAFLANALRRTDLPVEQRKARFDELAVLSTVSELVEYLVAPDEDLGDVLAEAREPVAGDSDEAA